jgi:predicted ATPase
MKPDREWKCQHRNALIQWPHFVNSRSGLGASPSAKSWYAERAVLESFQIRNFKSFADAKLQLRPLTVLIGANASGKTNLIEAMQLLAWMAEGRPLGQLLSAIRDEELSLRGSLSRLTWDADDPTVVFGCRVTPHLDLQVSLRLDSSPPAPRIPRSPRVVAETLRSDAGGPIYWLRDSADDPDLLAGEEAQSEAALLNLWTSTPGFVQLSHAGSTGGTLLSARIVKHSLRRLLVMAPITDAMRGYSHVMDRAMRADGANVSSVLRQLCEQGQETAVLDFVRALPEQDIVDIDFIETQLDDVMVRLQERMGTKTRWSEAAVLSDGTLRALAIAAAVLSVDPGSTLVIEEVDNGVHPSRVGRILDLIRREAERRDLRVLITTHNSALLDAIPDQDLAHVVACYRDPDLGDSRLIELGEMDRFPDLVARGSLGEVVSKGVLERFLKQTPEQRESANQAWLASLRAVQA